MEIMTVLRQATGPLHARIEELPICKAILDGKVSRLEYARLLQSLYHVHAGYESGLAKCDLVRRVWPATQSRAEAILCDLEVFGTGMGEPSPETCDWIEDIRALNHPAVWAGAGYVIEGSRMGSRVLARALAPAFGVRQELGVGLDYHLDAGDDPSGTWRQVMCALAALDDRAEARSALVSAAVRTFEVLYSLHETVGEATLSLVTVG